MNRSDKKKRIAGNVFLAIMFISILGLFSFEKQNERPLPAFQWEYETPEALGMSSGKLDEMKKVLEEKGTKKLLIIKDDKIVYEWFAEGWNDDEKSHYTASLAKALVSGLSLAAAMDDGYITLDEAACYNVPEWKENYRKSMITIRQLATHTSGLMDAQGTEGELKEMESKGSHFHYDLPGWRGQFWRQEPDPFSVSRDSTPMIAVPGARYAYSNPGIAMLTYAVTASLKNSKYSDVRNYLKERIYKPVGLDEKEYSFGYGKTFNVDGVKLVPSWGGGGFTARSVARLGLLMLHKGNWQGRQILDSSVVEKVTKYHYTALADMQTESSNLISNTRTAANPIPATTAGWYSNFDGVWENVPRDAFAGAGAQNQHLIVIPSLNMVIVRMGDQLFNEQKGEGFWLGTEKYLLNPIMDAIDAPPYPKSNLTVEFSPENDIIRMAHGSDNWPMTWADDDNLYTAYGDGNGFIPNTEIKLSLGLAKVSGSPPNIKGINIRSRTGEKVGDGKYGLKASGLLMVDGILYMLVRNAQNAGLMWSSNHGDTWEIAGWRFDVSFGYPTFLNYGKNYQDALDGYVYIYSQDDASAYKNSDHFVLARVPKEQIKDWRQYEYFSGITDNGQVSWSKDVRQRMPVFTNPGKCYRSGITYNKGLKKYLWCQTIQSSESEEFKGVRFKGGLGIFESSSPWGPWKTVFYTRDWDVGPGETSSIPVKWMSKDGKTCHIVFSGDDYFSVRKLVFREN